MFGWKGDALQKALNARCSNAQCKALTSQSSQQAMKCAKLKTVNEQTEGCKFSYLEISILLLTVHDRALSASRWYANRLNWWFYVRKEDATDELGDMSIQFFYTFFDAYLLYLIRMKRLCLYLRVFIVANKVSYFPKAFTRMKLMRDFVSLKLAGRAAKPIPTSTPRTRST